MAYLLLQAILDYPLVCIVLLLLGYIVGAASSGTKQWSPRAALASLRSWRGRAGDGAGLGAAGADALTTPSAQPPPGEAAPQEEPDDGISSSPWWGVDLEGAGQLVERMAKHDAGTEAGWKHMMDKETPGVFKYSAYRRPLPSGLTEYRTVTTAPNTSPLELMEFLLDDDARRGWEGFLAKATVLQQGAWPAREQVVRWVRRFPFHFLTDREYIIARKAWCMGPGNRLRPVSATTPGAPLYAITKGLDEHPAAPRTHALVRTSGFLSQWRCAAVPDPWGGPNPAAEVVLLHTEDIHVPEYLARTAVSMGMSKFVKELVGGLQGFTQARRGRGIGPHAADPLAYGHDFARTMSMLPSTSLHVGTGPKRNRDEEALPATADFETMGHMHPAASQPAGAGASAGAGAALCDGAGISAAESLHTHPHRRRYRHRLHRLLGRHSPKPHTAAATSPAAAAAPASNAITSLPKGAILLPNTGALTPSPPGSVASSGNASPLASSGAVTPLAVSPGAGSPAAAITAVATPAGWVVTPVTTMGGPLPSTPPSSPFAAAGVAAGAALREASQKVGAGVDGLPPRNLPWQRKLVVGVVSAAVLAGVRQLLQQQHRAVVGRAGPALPGKSSSRHRKGPAATAAAAPPVAAPDAAADAIVPSAVVKESAAPAAEVAAEVAPVPSARAAPSVTASHAIADAVADGITPGGASHVREDLEAAGGSRAGRAKARHSHYPKSFRLMDAEGQEEWGNLLGSASSSEGKV